MEVNIFKTTFNTGILNKTDKTIIIKCNKFYGENNSWQPLVYEQCKSFDKKYVYWLKYMGTNESFGIYISLNYIQNQKFLWLQDNHWFQKEDNIRYVINILFLILGCYLTIYKLP